MIFEFKIFTIRSLHSSLVIVTVSGKI